LYSVELSSTAYNFYKKLDLALQDRIKERLKRLEQEPVPSDAKFIMRHEGEKVFRLRIGDYRALYKVKDEQKIILVTKIDKRPRVYQ
jgi:mRNA interferase RelE/StbE